MWIISTYARCIFVSFLCALTIFSALIINVGVAALVDPSTCNIIILNFIGSMRASPPTLKLYFSIKQDPHIKYKGLVFIFFLLILMVLVLFLVLMDYLLLNLLILHLIILYHLNALIPLVLNHLHLLSYM